MICVKMDMTERLIGRNEYAIKLNGHAESDKAVCAAASELISAAAIYCVESGIELEKEELEPGKAELVFSARGRTKKTKATAVFELVRVGFEGIEDGENLKLIGS